LTSGNAKVCFDSVQKTTPHREEEETASGERESYGESRSGRSEDYAPGKPKEQCLAPAIPKTDDGNEYFFLP
jgi:hypothetical protein